MPHDRAEAARRMRAAKTAALVDLREHRMTIVEVLRDVPGPLRTAHIYEVLRSCPHVGKKKTERLLMDNHIWPFRAMAALTAAEKEALIRDLPDRLKETTD